MTPSDVRRSIESLCRERDQLMVTLTEAERRADELNKVVGDTRRRLSTVLIRLAETMPK